MWTRHKVKIAREEAEHAIRVSDECSVELNRAISEAGVASRKILDRFIRHGDEDNIIGDE